MMSLNQKIGILIFIIVLPYEFTVEVSALNSSITARTTFGYDSYGEACKVAEDIVWAEMKRTVLEHENAPAELLRLLFHDCFIQGCDASIMLDGSNGAINKSMERDAIPNKTLKGFSYINKIKELLERECPGVVSCADILVLASRDAIALTGRTIFPSLNRNERRLQSYFSEALAEIPSPQSNISHTLHLFARRGFNERETVALLGTHNIGRIGCQFIQPRLDMNDTSIPIDFLLDLRKKCRQQNESISNNIDTSLDGHYYKALKSRKGVLKADQELMADEKTSKVVREYAEDPITFRLEFASAMVKISNLNVLLESDGEVRRNCLIRNSS